MHGGDATIAALRPMPPGIMGCRTVKGTRMVSTKHDDRARQVALAVQQAIGIDTVLLFGSRARGDFAQDSDIDLLVIHPEGQDMASACRMVARNAARRLYGQDIPTDVVLMSPAVFTTMQFGLNHIAAKAAREGITPMGYTYQPPTGEEESEANLAVLEAMERCLHARRYHTQMQFVIEGVQRAQAGGMNMADPLEGELAFGDAAQGALEHALKALIAVHGAEYERTHDLNMLEDKGRQQVPEFRGLVSPAADLSYFAGGFIYGTPHLPQDMSTRHEQVQTDVKHLFALIEKKGQFDPWSVREEDFRG